MNSPSTSGVPSKQTLDGFTPGGTLRDTTFGFHSSLVAGAPLQLASSVKRAILIVIEQGFAISTSTIPGSPQIQSTALGDLPAEFCLLSCRFAAKASYKNGV
jgi:hypothetical protein